MGDVIQCADPDSVAYDIAKAIVEAGEVAETVKRFNGNLAELGKGKIGTANEKLLDSLIEVGGDAFTKVMEAIIVDLNDNMLQGAFSSYYSDTGEYHALDSRRN